MGGRRILSVTPGHVSVEVRYSCCAPGPDYRLYFSPENVNNISRTCHAEQPSNTTQVSGIADTLKKSIGVEIPEGIDPFNTRLAFIRCKHARLHRSQGLPLTPGRAIADLQLDFNASRIRRRSSGQRRHAPKAVQLPSVIDLQVGTSEQPVHMMEPGNRRTVDECCRIN